MSDISRMLGYGDDDEKMKVKESTVFWVLGILCLIGGVIGITLVPLLGYFLFGAAFILFIRALIKK